MTDKLSYKLNSGKPWKAWDFAKNFAKLLVPRAWYVARRERVLRKAALRSDYDYIRERAAYYMKYADVWHVPATDEARRERSVLHYTGTLGGYRRRMFNTAYYFDQRDVTRWFPKHLRWCFCPGDVYFTPPIPTIVKSRLLTADNAISVVLKLDKLRHFLFINDQKAFRDKQDRVIFRGKIRQSRVRTAFLKRFFAHPLFDCGVVGRNEGCPDEWMTDKKTIREHLDYKFIMALEGNDVASNLKWVMSSNSVAVMTRPTCETWFMEGTLKAGVHYIEVSEDFSDAEEKIRYYIEHPDEAETIIRNAHAYVELFFDQKREDIIQMLVLKRYMQTSGQM